MGMFLSSPILQLSTFNKENPMNYDTKQITTPSGLNFKVEIEHDGYMGVAAEIERRFREDQSAALTTELHRVKDDALFAEGIL